MTAKITVFGIVQGVGYRYFIWEKATEMELNGYVMNCRDGSVEIVIQGSEDDIEKIYKIAETGPRFSKVDKILLEKKSLERMFQGFSIKR